MLELDVLQWIKRYAVVLHLAMLSNMATRTSRPANESATATLYQVVAYNLRRAREERGLSRKQLSEQLHRITGTSWSPVALSQAENAWAPAPARFRHFDVNEVVAFALALGVPVSWFFLPPPVMPDGSSVVDKSHPWIETSTDSDGLTTDDLATLAVPTVAHLAGQGDDLYLTRLREELPEYEPVPPTAAASRYRRFKQRVQDALDEYEADS